ncbi:glycoside hydrolase family protein [Gracilibacillus massiliensis]|uniref:hypothetical protein n=1 Tax=Gracilibacillus massiliensis TaxID=1564956 RepID=UPI001E5C260A|nr:hypothetical protein [Gracilibacillus massiliensis]
MWYKDEGNNSETYCADSSDLYNWQVIGPVITDFPHEGVNVFQWKDSYWLIVDKWDGQAVYRSENGQDWTYNSTILDQDGTRPDDTGYGYHADVLVNQDKAYIFYFTHPERGKDPNQSYHSKRSSIQIAELEHNNGKIICDRNKDFRLIL